MTPVAPAVPAAPLASAISAATAPALIASSIPVQAGVYGLQDDYELALAKLGGGSVGGGRKPLIVTGTDLGQGLVVRCPWCNVASPLRQEWRGTAITCPNPDCQGPLRVNEFVVGT